MGKRKEEHEKENAERWLLTYADMITLLMLFFIVLYSMSTVDQQKFERLSESLSEAFGGNFGLFEKASGSAGILEGIQKPDLVAPKSAAGARAKLIDELKRIMRGNNIMATDNADGVHVTLFSDINFGVGQAAISDDGYTALRSVAPALASVGNRIRVQGYTDSMAVEPGSIDTSNWELSARRALAVLHALEEYGVPAERLSAQANGANDPIRPNDTPEGRSYNRRVEIVVLFDGAE
jgi:chemotaxis protein MotB